MYLKLVCLCVCFDVRLHFVPLSYVFLPLCLCVSLCVEVCACLCTCTGVVDKPHMRPLRHKGGNICIEGPLCPNLMEIQSSALSLCFLVIPAAKPQMDHYVPAELEGQETSNGNWNGGRDTLIQLRPSDTHPNRICSLCEVQTNTHLEMHTSLKRNKYAHTQIGWTHLCRAGYPCMINCIRFKCINAGRHTHTHIGTHLSVTPMPMMDLTRSHNLHWPHA